MNARTHGGDATADVDVARAAIRRAGLRATPQRLAALRAVHGAGGLHLSADEVWQALPRESAMDRTTAFRVLADLCEAGLILTARFGDGVARYEARSTTHHHAVCTKCGKTADIRADAVNDLAVDLRREFGFALGAAPLLLEGQCVSCE